jgi:hypothetical protein
MEWWRGIRAIQYHTSPRCYYLGNLKPFSNPVRIQRRNWNAICMFSVMMIVSLVYRLLLLRCVLVILQVIRVLLFVLSVELSHLAQSQRTDYTARGEPTSTTSNLCIPCKSSDSVERVRYPFPPLSVAQAVFLWWWRLHVNDCEMYDCGVSIKRDAVQVATTNFSIPRPIKIDMAIEFWRDGYL